MSSKEAISTCEHNGYKSRTKSNLRTLNLCVDAICIHECGTKIPKFGSLGVSKFSFHFFKLFNFFFQVSVKLLKLLCLIVSMIGVKCVKPITAIIHVTHGHQAKIKLRFSRFNTRKFPDSIFPVYILLSIVPFCFKIFRILSNSQRLVHKHIQFVGVEITCSIFVGFSIESQVSEQICFNDTMFNKGLDLLISSFSKFEIVH